MGYDFDYDCLSRYVADTCMDQINSYNTNGHSQIEDVVMLVFIIFVLLCIFGTPLAGIIFLALWLIFGRNKPSE